MRYLLILLFSFYLCLLPSSGFTYFSDDYLVEIGKTYLKKGNTDEAAAEFKQALIANPSNPEAQKYLEQIRTSKIKKSLDSFLVKDKNRPAVTNSTEPVKSSSSGECIASKKKSLPESVKPLSRREIRKTIASLKESKPAKTLAVKKEPAYPQEKIITPDKPQSKLLEPSTKSQGWEVKGNYQMAVGVEGDDFIWKKANADLGEERSRLLSKDNLNRYENTFDPAVYSQLNLQANYNVENGIGFNSEFDISPWSFIGKSQKIKVNSNWGDTADVQLKYWSATGYTIPENIYSDSLGAAFNLPEMKVNSESTRAASLGGTVWSGGVNDTFNIPELKIKREFWPLRELNFNYTSDKVKLKVFPVGKEKYALNSDDPLGITNHHTYWEESQWLTNWKPGHYNGGAGALDYFPGRFDDSLAFITKNSLGERLTSLRGFSLNLTDTAGSFDLSLASPKDLWQDYDSFNTYIGALRGKSFIADNVTLGVVAASKLGYSKYNLDEISERIKKNKLDAVSNSAAVDLVYGINPNTNISIEVATSRAKYDEASSFSKEKRGNAYHVNLINSSSDEIFGQNYFAINSQKQEPLYKVKLAYTHMDEGFESALSSYRETRDDAFWSRHVTFREPFQSYFPGLYEPGLTWDSVKTFGIGDGVDYGRDVVNFRAETQNLAGGRLSSLVDVRNVHSAHGRFIENVSRLETTYKPITKLTTKLLGIYHHLPHTNFGVDPFIFNPLSGDYYENPSIEDGLDPTLKTVSVGANYDFFDWLNLNFVWERSNDTTLAYDDFPRLLYSWTSFTTYREYDKKYRKETYGLNHTDAFSFPPYKYYNIFKTGLGIRPNEKLKLYFDYTDNEYNWSQIIDDSGNHIGFEASYIPIEKLGFNFRYVYSKANDISRLDEDNEIIKKEHHNFFSEIKLSLEATSELVAQYGAGNVAGIVSATQTPFGGGVPVLDTQHIVKLYYHKKF